MTKLTEFLEKGLAQSATTSNEMSIIFKIKKNIYIPIQKSANSFEMLNNIFGYKLIRCFTLYIFNH